MRTPWKRKLEALTASVPCHEQIQGRGTKGCSEWLVWPQPEPLREREWVKRRRRRRGCEVQEGGVWRLAKSTLILAEVLRRQQGWVGTWVLKGPRLYRTNQVCAFKTSFNVAVVDDDDAK